MTRNRPTVSGRRSPLETFLVWLVIVATGVFVIGAFWQAMSA